MAYHILLLWFQIKVHFSVHKQKLTKLGQYLTVFPSHFYNIFLKSFRLLQNLTRNCEILQQLMRFHKTNNISQNFSGIVTLGFCEVAKYFVDFQFCFRYFQKMTPKFRFHSFIFEILKFRTLQWRKFKKSISQLTHIMLSIIYAECHVILLLCSVHCFQNALAY